MISLTLPFPPSLNTLYATYKSRRILSHKGRTYHQRIIYLVRKALGRPEPLSGRIEVSYTFCAPDHQRRDLSNFTKALADALTMARVWQDDSQIDAEHLYRGAVVKGGSVTITINEIEKAKA